MKLAVIGSRSFRDRRLMDAKLKELSPAQVISGGANGADHIAAVWARKNGVDVQVFWPDHKRHRHPYHHRNRLIAEACDQLIAFWDGASTGTKYTIDYARRIGKPVMIVRY